MSLVLTVQIASTLFMTGLIWFVQIVHYPLFAQVGRDEFGAYAEQHARRTAWVVGPVMVTELITAIALLVQGPPAAQMPLHIAGIVVLGVIWLSTAFIQVPQHEGLRRGATPAGLAALMRGNWIRTVAWSARAVLVLWLINLSSS